MSEHRKSKSYHDRWAKKVGHLLVPGQESLWGDMLHGMGNILNRKVRLHSKRVVRKEIEGYLRDPHQVL